MTAYLLTDSLTMLRRTLRRMRRYPSLTFFIAGIPVVLLLLFVYVFGGDARRRARRRPPRPPADAGRDAYIAYVVPGILLITVAGAGPGTAISVAMDMTTGIIARFRTMAIARASVLTGHVIGTVIQTMLALGIVLVVATLIGFRPTTGPVEWLAALGLLALTAIAISWLSVGLGLAADSVETASNTPMFLMLLPFLSSAFVPIETLPGPLAWFAEHQPFTPIIETLRGLLVGHADRHQRGGRGRLVRRDLGGRLPLVAPALRAGPGHRRDVRGRGGRGGREEGRWRRGGRFQSGGVRERVSVRAVGPFAGQSSPSRSQSLRDGRHSDPGVPCGAPGSGCGAEAPTSGGRPSASGPRRP